MNEQLRAQYADKSDRDLMLEIIGLVQPIHTDYYGDDERSIRGTKPQVEQNTLDIDRAKTAGRVLYGAIGLIGVGNIVAWLTLV